MTITNIRPELQAWFDAARNLSGCRAAFSEFVEDFRMAACLGMCRPGSRHYGLLQTLLPALPSLRATGELDRCFDFLFELQHA